MLSGASEMAMDWQGAPASPSSYTVKRILRLDIPVDSFPNVSFQEDAMIYNFIRRIIFT